MENIEAVSTEEDDGGDPFVWRRDYHWIAFGKIKWGSIEKFRASIYPGMAADPFGFCASDLSDIFRQRQPLSRISALFLCNFLFVADYLRRTEFESEGGLADPRGVIDECRSCFSESDADAHIIFRIGDGRPAGNDAEHPKRGDPVLYSLRQCKKLDKDFREIYRNSKALSLCKSGEHWRSVDDGGACFVDKRENDAKHIFPESGDASV